MYFECIYSNSLLLFLSPFHSQFQYIWVKGHPHKHRQPSRRHTHEENYFYYAPTFSNHHLPNSSSDRVWARKKSFLKLIWKKKRIAKAILSNNKSESITLPDFRLSYSAINQTWSLHISQHTNQWIPWWSPKKNHGSTTNLFLIEVPNLCWKGQLLQ